MENIAGECGNNIYLTTPTSSGAFAEDSIEDSI